MRARGEILTGSFDLFLCGFVPHVDEAKDSVVILILTDKRQYKPHNECFFFHINQQNHGKVWTARFGPDTFQSLGSSVRTIGSSTI